MEEYTDMTFIWSEISFLQLWWDQAHPTKQRVKNLFKFTVLDFQNYNFRLSSD